jgi:hypothetical protein
MTVAHAAHMYRIQNWYGAITEGVSAGEFTGGSDPDVIFPPWGRGSLVVAARWGIGPAGGASVSGTTYPLWFLNGTSTFANGTADTAMQSAYTRTIDPITNSGAFAGTFSGFSETHTIQVAVRGLNGTPPVANGVDTVQVDDTDSQDDHNAIRTYVNDGNLFATEADADTWADLIIATHADDRPIINLSFYATRSTGYRMQAVRRRVGHKITVIATNNAGLGISQDFFIENIKHRWSNGVHLWETTWELSPA